MEKQVFRQRIDDSVLNSIRDKIINYLRKSGVSNCDVIYKRMMDRVGGLYVENLIETQHCRMQHRGKPSEIVVDVSFCSFDKNNRFIGFDSKLAKLIESQLGHELLHAASSEFTPSKTNPYRSGLIVNGNERGLNEGFTQLITENIFGYVVSSNSDGYHFFKKIAKVLEATYGKRLFLESYFHDSKALSQKLEECAPEYYRILNNRLTHAYFARGHVTNLESYYELISRDVILNIVVPQIKKKSPSEANAYLKNICLYFSDDYEFATTFLDIVQKYLKLNANEFVQEKAAVNQKTSEKSIWLHLYQQCNKAKDIFSVVTITPDGRTMAKYNNRFYMITDPKVLDMIYGKVFEAKYLDPNKIGEYEQKVLTDLSSINNQIRFNPRNKDNLMYKRAVLAFYKKVAAKNDYVILNEISEVEVGKNIDLRVMRLNNKKTQFNFKELEACLSKYDFNYISNNSYEIVDKATGKRVDNKYIISMASFAYLWLSAFGTRWISDEKIPGSTAAFSGFSESIYNEFCSIVYKSMSETGTFDVDKIAEKLQKNRGFSSVHGPLSTMFANPISTQMVYKYFISKMPKNDKKLQTETTKIYRDDIDYQAVVEGRIDEMLPSNNKSVYEELMNELASNNFPKGKSSLENYRLFLAYADASANATSIGNEIVAETNLTKALELVYDIVNVNINALNYDSATPDEKMQFCVYFMGQALRKKDINLYNCYRDRYNNVIQGKTGSFSY